MLAKGADPRDWLREQEAGPGAHPKRVRKTDGWTWEEGRGVFLKHIEQHRKAATQRDYRAALTFLQRGMELLIVAGLIDWWMRPMAANNIHPHLLSHPVMVFLLNAVPHLDPI